MAESLGGGKPESFKPQQKKLEFGEQKVGEDLSEGKSKDLGLSGPHYPPKPLYRPAIFENSSPVSEWGLDSSSSGSKVVALSESGLDGSYVGKDPPEGKFKCLNGPDPGVAKIVPLSEFGEGEDLQEGQFEHLDPLPVPIIPYEAKILPSSESGLDSSSSGSKFVGLSESGLNGPKVGEPSLILEGNNREEGGTEEGHRDNDSVDDEVLLHKKRKLEEHGGVEDQAKG